MVSYLRDHNIIYIHGARIYNDYESISTSFSADSAGPTDPIDDR